MDVILFLPFIVYCFLLVGAIISWLSLPNLSVTTQKYDLPDKITVLIPVRNEAKTIQLLLEDLDKQTYPANKFEVIVIDDYSTDDTAKLVQGFQLSASYQLRILQPVKTLFSTYSPKKQAITYGVNNAEGTIIVATDGDCRVGENWLSSYAQFYTQKDAFFIAGPVTFCSPERHTSSLLNKIITWTQIVEFASLIGSGACAIAVKKPNMCSGANLSYKKEAFEAVDGYVGNEQIASGDDEFLLHKIATRFPDKFFFIKDEAAIVETSAHQNWSSFYHQRKRWASKWKQYQSITPTLLAVFIFWVNATSLYLLGYVTLYASSFSYVMLLVARWLLEGIFLFFILRFLRKKTAIAYIPLVQLFYPMYVLFFGIIAQRKSPYRWKGRSMT